MDLHIQHPDNCDREPRANQEHRPEKIWEPGRDLDEPITSQFDKLFELAGGLGIGDFVGLDVGVDRFEILLIHGDARGAACRNLAFVLGRPILFDRLLGVVAQVG